MMFQFANRILSIAFIIVFSISWADAQIYWPCGDFEDYGCTAGDVTVVDAWIGDPVTGARFGSCTEGQTLTGTIWMRYTTNTNSDRLGVWMLGTLYKNEFPVEGFDFWGADYDYRGECVRGILPASKGVYRNEEIYDVPITFQCGDTLELRNFVLHWETVISGCTGDPLNPPSVCCDVPSDCANRNTKCYKKQNFIIMGPPECEICGAPQICTPNTENYQSCGSRYCFGETCTWADEWKINDYATWTLATYPAYFPVKTSLGDIGTPYYAGTGIQTLWLKVTRTYLGNSMSTLCDKQIEVIEEPDPTIKTT